MDYAQQEATSKVALESAVLAFLPVYADASHARDVADWRKYFSRLCRTLVRGEGSELFSGALADAAATVEAKLTLRFRGDDRAATFFVSAVLQLARRATFAARKAKAEGAWWPLAWDGTGEGNPAEVAGFEPAVLRGAWAARLALAAMEHRSGAAEAEPANALGEPPACHVSAQARSTLK